MTHSGFKTAQKRRNLGKKENNNKDYRSKRNNASLSNCVLHYDYVLRTKHGIKLNGVEEKELFFHRDLMQYNLKGRSDEENIIIQQEVKNYMTKGIIGSYDKTHTDHSKLLTRNRNFERKRKMEEYSYF